MKRILICLLGLVLPVIQLTAAEHRSKGDDETEIRRAQKARIDAVVHADRAQLEKVLADDMTYIHSSGKLDSKKSYIESLVSGQVVYHAIDTSELNYRKHGNTWILIGKAKLRVTAGGRDSELLLRFTEVYIKSGNSWQLEAYESTKLPEVK